MNMELTKFREMCKAFGKAQKDFKTFQHSFHHLAIELVNELKVYFEVPPSQFSLYKINEENEFVIVPPSLINALSLKEDSTWQFGIGLTICFTVETLPQELILIHVILRTDADGKYFVKYGTNPKEFELIKEDTNSFHPFFDFLHDTVIQTYEEQLQHFIDHNTRRKLGYESEKVNVTAEEVLE